MTAEACPCGSGRDYAQCCGLYLSGQQSPLTAEALMRSRYTAYARRNADYLQQTWHPSTRPPVLALESQSSLKWLGLKILRTQDGGEHDDTGLVQFVARYKVGGKAGRLQETSHFIKQGNHWFYLQGDVSET